jgi:hypothetical protein
MGYVRLVWGVGLAVIACALIAPGSAAAACADALTKKPYRCNIVADSFDVAPNPVAAGQLVTFTAKVHSKPADIEQNGEAAADVEYTIKPDFDPGDDPGDLQSATVTSQPSAGNWVCGSTEPVVCHGPLNAGNAPSDAVTFKAVYRATGSTRTAFMDLHMTEMPGEQEDFCGSVGADDCDQDDEDRFTGVDIQGSSTPGGGGGGQKPGGGSANPSVFDVIPPAFLGASITPRAFVVGSQPTAEFGRAKATAATGTKIVYNLSEAATVRMAVERKLEGRRVRGKCVRRTRGNRKKRRCARYVEKGALVRRGAKGISVIPWTGRIGRRVVKPGRYRMSLVAVDAANNRSAPRRMFFRVKKPKRKPARKH